MKRSFFPKYLPLLLLGTLLLVGLITIFTQASKYGITIDEPLHDQYGHAVMEWYLTLGKDTSFLNFPTNAYVPEHGGIFDAVASVAQHMFPAADHWYVLRIAIALTGLLGLGAIALCGYEMGGYWVAFLAALALWLYPRYYGAIYNNPKDIPATVTTTLIIWGVLLLVKQWGREKRYLRNSVLVAFFIGLAASIRVTSVIWYAILALVAVVWWLINRKRIKAENQVRTELTKQGISALIIGLGSWLTMIVLWPYVFLSPVKNLLRSIKVLSQYPWNGTVLYNGSVTLATQLPRTYTLEWLVIGSPPTLIVFALLGLGIVCVLSVKKRLIDPGIAIVVLSLVAPLGAIVILHSEVYDTLRQFLFLIPSIILLAVYGFVQAVKYLMRQERKALRWTAVGLATLTLVSYGFVVKDMVELSPFEYTYFSPIVGGLPGAANKFDTDYWAICSEQAGQWLTQNYQRYTTAAHPTIDDDPISGQVAPFIPSTFQEDDTHPDFYLTMTRNGDDRQFPAYTVIHVVGVEGVPFCVIKVNSALIHSTTLSGSNSTGIEENILGLVDARLILPGL